MEYGISTVHVFLTSLFVAVLLFSERTGKRILFLSAFTLLLLWIVDFYFVVNNRIEVIYLSRSFVSFLLLLVSFIAITLLRRMQYKRRPFKYV
jgi:hypothetical protein